MFVDFLRDGDGLAVAALLVPTVGPTLLGLGIIRRTQAPGQSLPVQFLGLPETLPAQEHHVLEGPLPDPFVGVIEEPEVQG